MSIWTTLVDAAARNALRSQGTDGICFVEMRITCDSPRIVGVGRTSEEAWWWAYAQLLDRAQLMWRWGWLVERCHEEFGFDSVQEMMVRAAARRADPAAFGTLPAFFYREGPNGGIEKHTGRAPQW